MSGNQEVEFRPMKNGEVIRWSAYVCVVALRMITDYTSNQHYPKRHLEAKGFHRNANLRKCLLLCCLYTLTFFFFSPGKERRKNNFGYKIQLPIKL